MTNIEYDRAKLKSGDFDEVDIVSLFENNLFKYIFDVIEGCDKKVDYNILALVSIYAQFFLIKPNAKKWDKEQLKTIMLSSGTGPGFMDEMTYEELTNWWNSEITLICERILSEVVIVGIKHYIHYKTILDQLSTNTNENVRLYCCANLDYSKFLNDPSPRVAKVANIRYEFDQKWKSLNEEDQEKQRIKFLVEALEKGAIERSCNLVYIVCPLEDQIDARFTSILFQNSPLIRFDKDIFYKITDKRILANALNELIKEGTITPNYDIMPDCFKKPKPLKKLKEISN